MNDKETGELRRRLKTDKCAVNCIYGCFVNEKKEIVSQFRQTLGLMDRDDSDCLLNIIRKTLSGTLGKNLIDLPFTNEQVMDSPEHRLLSDLRMPGEHCEEAVRFFFETAAESLAMEENYLILLAQDAYDVPSFGSDGNKAEESETVFNYCICAVCPLKDTKPALGFYAHDNSFRSLTSDRVLGFPELGFMFPSFDDRAANIYDVLYYTKNTQNNHPEFIENVLHLMVPMPADEQKETFNSILSETLSEDCSLNVAVAVRDSICETITEYKTEKKEEDPPVITKRSVSRVLEDCGVSAERVEAFGKKYDESFGEAAELPMQNFVDTKQISVATPDVSIKISSDRSDLIQTRVIDGKHYILIRAESSVEVNGVSINIR